MGALYRYRARAVYSITSVFTCRHQSTLLLSTIRTIPNCSMLVKYERFWFCSSNFTSNLCLSCPHLDSVTVHQTSAQHRDSIWSHTITCAGYILHSDTPGYSVWPVCIREGKWHMTEAPLLTLSIAMLFTHTLLSRSRLRLSAGTLIYARLGHSL